MKLDKKLGTAVLALAALTLASPAMAVSFWGETFPYSNGNLTAVSGGLWVNHSGTGSFIQVSGGEAVLVQGSGSREDVNRSFTPRDSLDKTYACFKVTVPTAPLPITDVYFAHLKDSGTFNFAARVFVTGSGSSFTFGLAATSSTIGATWPSALNFGQQYTVAIMYDAAAGSAKLWVDPTSESSPSITVTGGTAKFLIEAFAMRQAGGNTSQLIDNVGVGTTFDDICPSPTPTNATTWGRVKTLYR